MSLIQVQEQKYIEDVQNLEKNNVEYLVFTPNVKTVYNQNIKQIYKAHDLNRVKNHDKKPKCSKKLEDIFNQIKD